MIYEMRTYRAAPGRLPHLLRRFEDCTLELWTRHAIRQAGFWTVEVGNSNHDLIYMLAWESMAERESKWKAFLGDPEWMAKKTASEQAGPLVETITNAFLSPTAFSAVK